jgi:hypothetical protein
LDANVAQWQGGKMPKQHENDCNTSQAVQEGVAITTFHSESRLIYGRLDVNSNAAIVSR